MFNDDEIRGNTCERNNVPTLSLLDLVSMDEEDQDAQFQLFKPTELLELVDELELLRAKAIELLLNKWDYSPS